MIIQSKQVLAANPQWQNVSVKPDGKNSKIINVKFTFAPPESCQQQQPKSGADILKDLLKGLAKDIFSFISDALSLINPAAWLKSGGPGPIWDDLVDEGVDIAKKIWDAFHGRTNPPTPTVVNLKVPVIELDPQCLTGYSAYVTCKGHLTVEGSGPTETAAIREQLSWNAVDSSGCGISSPPGPYDHDASLIDYLTGQSGKLACATVEVDVTLTAASAGDFGSKPQPISKSQLSSVTIRIEDNCPGH